jgi:DNA-binding transcriptional ArsR family regulator
MDTRRDAFQAIADPNRRQILSLLAHEPQNLNAIAENFSVTRQAVSLHLRILEECGLVQIKNVGRERICSARLENLGEVSAWIDQYRAHWEKKIDSLEKCLATQKKERHVGKRKK